MVRAPIREALAAKPFVPFKLRVPNGTDAEVPHPEFFWFHPASDRIVVVASADGGIRLLDLLLVSELIFEGRASEGERRRSA